jgi:hypothetical protein
MTDDLESSRDRPAWYTLEAKQVQKSLVLCPQRRLWSKGYYPRGLEHNLNRPVFEQDTYVLGCEGAFFEAYWKGRENLQDFGRVIVKNEVPPSVFFTS